MRDINFFKPYIVKKEFKLDKRIIFFGIVSFALLLFIAYTIHNSIVINRETAIVNKLRATAEDSDTLKKVEEIRQKEVQLNEFKASVEKIKALDEKIISQDIIKEELLEIISLRMPENLVLTYLGVDNPIIEIRGAAQDKWSVAEFAKGLEDIENAEDIFVSNITTEDGFYSFGMTITLKDVNDVGETADN